jgi:hypothetical protein
MLNRLMWLLLLLVAAGPTWAGDPVFPPGSRVGLTPPEGFVPGTAYPGFENREKRAVILITELPASAYVDLERKVADEQLWRQGVMVETREEMPLGTGPAFLVTGHQEAEGQTYRRWILFGSTPELTAIVSVQVPEVEKDAYPDAIIRAALATFAVRATAPAEEQLEALPFRLGDLAGFRVARVVAGTAALLTDGPSETLDVAEQPLVFIAAIGGTVPAQAGDRDRFARGVLAETPGIKEIRLMRSEPLRIGGLQGHEILAQAKDIKTNSDVMVAQWLRFGLTGQLRVLGMARKDGWAETFARLRAIRDGIELR